MLSEDSNSRSCLLPRYRQKHSYRVSVAALWIAGCVLAYWGICRLFAYDGYQYTPNHLKMPVLFLNFLVLAWFFDFSTEVRSLLVDSLLLLIYTPTIITWVFGSVSPTHITSVNLAVVVILAVTRPRVRWPGLRLGGKHARLLVEVLVGLSLTYFLVVEFVSGAYQSVVGGSEIAEQRDIFFGALPWWGGYLFNNITKCLGPFIISLNLLERRWLEVAVLSLLYLMVCALCGMRASLFYLPLVLVATMAVRDGFIKLSPLVLFRAAVVFGCVVTILAMYLGVDQVTMLWSIGPRRILYLPVKVADAYYQEFSDARSFLKFADVLSPTALEYKGYYSLPNYISSEYLGMQGGSANCNFIANAYANLGILGVLLYSLVLAVWSSVVSSYSRYCDKDTRICLMVSSLLPILSLVNSSLTVSFFTHGLLMQWVLAMVRWNRSPQMTGQGRSQRHRGKTVMRYEVPRGSP